MSIVERLTRNLVCDLLKQGVLNEAQALRYVEEIEERRGLNEAYRLKKATQFGLSPDNIEDLFYAIGIKYDPTYGETLAEMTRKRGRPTKPLPPGTEERHDQELSKGTKPSIADYKAAKGEKRLAERLRKRRAHRRIK
jgi:hypothetical protein